MTIPKPATSNGLLTKLWGEAEPIATHAFVVLVLECSLLLVSQRLGSYRTSRPAPYLLSNTLVETEHFL